MKKNILFLTWKDLKHPNAGWAEKVIYEYAKWLVKKGYEITWFWYEFPWCKPEEVIDWIKIIRKFTLKNSYFLFHKYYKENLAWKYDLIIDEAGGLPFLTTRFIKDTPIIFFAHHIWDKEWDFAYPWPINKIWKKIYYWMFKQYKNIPTITVSDSTKNELINDFWFKKENIKVIENTLDLKPIEKIDFSKKKNKIVFLWRLMPMKRVEDAIKAFHYLIFNKNEEIKQNNYELDIVWWNQDKKYVEKLHKLVRKLNLISKVNFVWYNKKVFDKSLDEAKLMLVPSYKEWFWLIVLEANAYWLPVIWYDVAWLRDSIKDWINWYKVEWWNYKAMWDKLIGVLEDEKKYKKLAEKSLEYVKTLDWWYKKVDEFEGFILNKI